jgi:hypothetical protein
MASAVSERDTHKENTHLAQQVAQLLREKLHNVCGDLAEAKNRIAELESVQLCQRAI